MEVDVWSYTRLLEISRNREEACETSEPASTAEYEWFSHLMEPVRYILESGKRLAQEHFGWVFLTGQRTWSSK